MYEGYAINPDTGKINIEPQYVWGVFVDGEMVSLFVSLKAAQQGMKSYFATARLSVERLLVNPETA